jgi:hypothetical protein
MSPSAVTIARGVGGVNAALDARLLARRWGDLDEDDNAARRLQEAAGAPDGLKAA